MAAVLAVMLLLMVCGCLYIRDFFRKDHKDSALKADSVREAVPGVEENKPDTEFPEQEKYTVVLDAGHGGEDGGTVEQTATEKEINLAVVLKMRELLENQGICVVLTREQDKKEDDNRNRDLYGSINPAQRGRAGSPWF